MQASHARMDSCEPCCSGRPARVAARSTAAQFAPLGAVSQQQRFRHAPRLPGARRRQAPVLTTVRAAQSDSEPSEAQQQAQQPGAQRFKKEDYRSAVQRLESLLSRVG